MTRPDWGVAPARRQRGAAPPSTRSEPPAEAFADDEIAKGQALAVLGALGRLQMRLDVLAREHAQSMEEIRAALARIEARGGHVPTSARETPDAGQALEEMRTALGRPAAPSAPPTGGQDGTAPTA